MNGSRSASFYWKLIEKKPKEPAKPTKRRRTLQPSEPITEFRMTGGNWHASKDPTLANLEKEHEEITKVKNIKQDYHGRFVERGRSMVLFAVPRRVQR
jgi:hypothetical protein